MPGDDDEYVVDQFDDELEYDFDEFNDDDFDHVDVEYDGTALGILGMGWVW